MKPIRILLVDDHGLMRLGLTTLMKYHKDLSVIGGADNGKEAVEQAKALKPDVIVMDLMMPVMDGVEATRRIHAELPEIKIMILTTFGTSTDVARAVQAGAVAALMKDTPNDELLNALRAIAAGEHVFSPEIRKTIAKDPDPPVLTERQKEILKFITSGLRNSDVARQLGISTDAVKQHLNAICNKLGAVNRAEAIAIALRKQLLKI